MILVSTDGSELSEKAIVTAAKLAKNLKTSVLGMTVVKAKGGENALHTLEDVTEICERRSAMRNNGSDWSLNSGYDFENCPGKRRSLYRYGLPRSRHLRLSVYRFLYSTSLSKS